MKLDFTTSEFLSLLKAIYLADCVANSHADDPADMNWEIAKLRRTLFAKAGEAGLSEAVRHDPAHDDYLESDELAEELDATILRHHVDKIFWRELAARLADQIMDQKFGAEMAGWNDRIYQRRREPIQKKVEAELEANGMKNLFLLGDFS